MKKKEIKKLTQKQAIESLEKLKKRRNDYQDALNKRIQEQLTTLSTETKSKHISATFVEVIQTEQEYLLKDYLTSNLTSRSLFTLMFSGLIPK